MAFANILGGCYGFPGVQACVHAYTTGGKLSPWVEAWRPSLHADFVLFCSGDLGGGGWRDKRFACQ